MVFGPFTIKVIKGGSWMGVRGVIFWGWVGLQVIHLTLYGFFLTPYIMASRDHNIGNYEKPIKG